MKNRWRCNYFTSIAHGSFGNTPLLHPSFFNPLPFLPQKNSSAIQPKDALLLSIPR
jgi:hypothetical protein